MSSVTLQNSVRVRMFLILTLSICIRLLRPLNAVGLHKLTTLMAYNYFFYGLITLCTLIPHFTAWVVATVCQCLATTLDLVCFVLGFVSVWRCVSGEQMGCVQNAPPDIVSLLLIGAILTLDAIQTWAAYRVLRFPTFTGSSVQRVRVLMCWSLPFPWLASIVLWSESKWTLWLLGRFFVDPSVIFLSGSGEYLVLATLMSVGIICDVIALLQVSEELARWALLGSVGLTAAGIFMLFTGDVLQATAATADTLKPLDSQKPVVVVEDDKRLRLRQKSDKASIVF